MNSEEKLGKEKILPLIIKMSIPAIMAQVVNLLYNIVDRMYIGHIPKIGTLALAGVGITASIIILISAFAMLIGSGGAPVAAMSLGRGDRDKAEKILANGFLLLIIFSVVISVLVYIFRLPILHFIGASNETIKYANDYLSIYLFGTVFVLLAVGLNQFITSQGNSLVAMISVLIGAVLNIILDPIFIFVFNLDVKGAAIATVISQFFSALFTVCFLFSKKATLKIIPSKMKLKKSIISPMFSIGISPFIMGCTESMIGFALNGQLQKYGGDIYVSALTIMLSAMQIICVPLTGMGQGITPIISYNYGAKNNDRVKKCFKDIAIIMFISNIIITALVMMFPQGVASLFTTDKKLIAVVCNVLPYFASGMLIFGLQRACQYSFVALGQAKASLFIALLRKVILLIPLAFILPKYFGVHGVYIAEPIADVISAITCTTLFLVKFPKILKSNKSIPPVKRVVCSRAISP